MNEEVRTASSLRPEMSVERGKVKKTDMNCRRKGTTVKPVYNLPPRDYFSHMFI
jgi:hypothetical protein